MNILPTITAYFVIIKYIYINIYKTFFKLCNYGNYFLYIVAHTQTYIYIFKIYFFFCHLLFLFGFFKLSINWLDFIFLNHVNWEPGVWWLWKETFREIRLQVKVWACSPLFYKSFQMAPGFFCCCYSYSCHWVWIWSSASFQFSFH